MLVGHYDSSLVWLSWVVASLAAYTALDMVSRITMAYGAGGLGGKPMWVISGAIAMGIGIWAMHFVGMLAFSLPIKLNYDTGITLISMVIAIATSAFALNFVASAHALDWTKLSISALIMGIGVAAMHYTGMAALRMAPGIQYDPVLFAASIVIAIAASGAALWIFFQLRKDRSHLFLLRVVAAAIMGVAVIGMHYTGMAAAHFVEGSICMASTEKSALNPNDLTMLIVASTLFVLIYFLFVSALEKAMA